MGSLIGDAARHLGHEISSETHKVLETIERSPAYVANILKTAGIGGGMHVPGTGLPSGSLPGVRPIRPGAYAGLPKHLPAPYNEQGCAQGGAKPWTITSTIAIAAGALAADTDLGSTTNPFASANSGFFTSTGVFPWPFVANAIGGLISLGIPTSQTEFASVGDSFYVSMRGATELARYSATRDLGFAMSKEQGLTAAAAVALMEPTPMKSWEQFFDPRSTYTWGIRLPKAVTTVAAISITFILAGLLYEGLVLGN